MVLGGTGKEQGKRHPTIGHNVVVSSNAIVLGSITIGNNVKIGAGSVVLADVPDNCTVVGVPGRIVVKDGCRVNEGEEVEDGRCDDPVFEKLNELSEKVELLENIIKEKEVCQLKFITPCIMPKREFVPVEEGKVQNVRLWSHDL